MNLFQLLFKQMRQRALGTTLTMLSVVLGVGLAVAIMLLYHAGATIFGQSDYGYDVLLGISGSPLQLTMNTVYMIDKSQGNIPYTAYKDLINPRMPYRSEVRIAVPYVVGDSYKGVYRIVGTMPKLFGYDDDDITKTLPEREVMEYRPGRRYEIAEGRVFDRDKFEAIIGSDVAKQTGLKIGDIFQATHGFPLPGETPDIHAEKWKVVGILAPTHTASDRVLFIAFTSFYTIAEHGVGLETQYYISHHLPIPELKEDVQHYTVNPATQKIHLLIPDEMLAVSAILVKSRGGVTGQDLMYQINHQSLDPNIMAVNPASVMRDFFETFFNGTERLLLIIALLVTIVAAMGILVSIYNSVTARMREIAILRALGATRQKVLVLICAEAGFIGLMGGFLGLIVGHAMGAVGSYVMTQTIGQGFDWWTVGSDQLIYWAVVVVIAVVAGLVPALKAYSVPVATNLVMT
jgi:putative ABC transport system permease protein